MSYTCSTVLSAHSTLIQQTVYIQALTISDIPNKCQCKALRIINMDTKTTHTK